MTVAAPSRDDQRIARALGLKLPVYRYLRAALARGEDPVWLRTADPELAGMFPNAFGFELLLERFDAEEAVERRRANLLRLLDERGLGEIEGAVADAADEGELEDLALALEPAPAPESAQKPEKPEHAAFLERLRGDAGVARELRRLFREKATVRVEVAEGKENEARAFKPNAGQAEPLLGLNPARYLALRRGEHEHVLRMRFELPAAELRAVFDRSVQGYPPQERDSYWKLFQTFVDEERLPRVVAEARARLKRQAENFALQQAWQNLEHALDRGRHDGTVLGLAVVRPGKLMLALMDAEGVLVRTSSLPAKAEDLGERLLVFLGEHRPTLVAAQADSPTRAGSEVIVNKLRAGGGEVRVALVPTAVVKTLLREVARRPGETHLTHDERQPLLLARLAWEPRAGAFHTPHILRAYIPFRAEINSRRLDAFEASFLRSLLLERGVDVNHGARDTLRLVPGVDAEAVLVERATAPFRSLEDFQARLDLAPADWRAAMCFLRVREGDNPLDARPLHPSYYAALQQAAAAGDVAIAELLREPERVRDLPWEPVLAARNWRPAVVDLVRQGLFRGGRRPRRGPGRPPVAQRLEALEIGASLRGVVTSLTAYGAFVDVGARREGLVHVSEMADQFVKDPAEVVQVGQEVTVRVLAVDLENQRFRLSMRTGSEEKPPPAAAPESQRAPASPVRDTRPRSRPMGRPKPEGERKGEGRGGAGGRREGGR
ncbi:MAG: S1 RNA-binding domain-containing protein, partial [Planctomycetota bacterium]